MNSKQDLRWELPKFTRGTGIEISTAPTKAFPHFISVSENNTEVQGHSIPPDVRVKQIQTLDLFSSQSLDFIVTNRMSEVVDYFITLTDYWSKIKNGGHLAMILPESVDLSLVLDLNIKKLKNVVTVCDKQYGDEESTVRLLILKKAKNLIIKQRGDKPTAFVSRMGAFGDNMQASSVVAGLAKQGYDVIYMGSAPGLDVVLHDPNIFDFYNVDKDQIPNHNLVEFWNYQATQHDKFINLSESVECTWLAQPGRTPHEWHPALREKFMNYNYLQFQHELAQVPHEPNVKFYPTQEEKQWAFQQRQNMGKHVVMWSLSGSGVHKTWNGDHSQGFDQTIARILTWYGDVDILMVGGPEALMLTEGWQDNERIHIHCGDWTIRQTLTMLSHVDLIVGPETGVLNAACCMDQAKIVFLSHSTEENLTRDWVNTQSLSADNVTCPGRGNNEAKACHQMHFGWKNCKQNENTGTAECQAKITVEMVWDAIKKVMDKKGKRVMFDLEVAK
jgi:ADP-heptose:LPS heptosyltransferase